MITLLDIVVEVVVEVVISYCILVFCKGNLEPLFLVAHILVQ